MYVYIFIRYMLCVCIYLYRYIYEAYITLFELIGLIFFRCMLCVYIYLKSCCTIIIIMKHILFYLNYVLFMCVYLYRHIDIHRTYI